MATKRQMTVLAVIHRHIKSKGFAPSYREIADQCGRAAHSWAHAPIIALERDGYLTRTETSARSIVLTDEGRQAAENYINANGGFSWSPLGG